jgi:membrane-bound transcription factor site-1 protease
MRFFLDGVLLVFLSAQLLYGSRIDGGCRTLSGTSVASPVVAGAVALLASAVPPQVSCLCALFCCCSSRMPPLCGVQLVNPAVMKQALLASSERLPDLNIFEQGSGKMNVPAALEYLQAYTPRVTLFPEVLNLTDCPYMWPYCEQPLYYTGLPVVANVTVINGIGSTGSFASEPEWHPGNNGERLKVRRRSRARPSGYMCWCC